jgi:hypothetical protein
VQEVPESQTKHPNERSVSEPLKRKSNRLPLFVPFVLFVAKDLPFPATYHSLVFSFPTFRFLKYQSVLPQKAQRAQKTTVLPWEVPIP